MHTHSALLRAVNLAGSRANLCTILNIPQSNLSSWSNGHVSMPIKHAKTIEQWSNGEIPLSDMYPDHHDQEILEFSNQDTMRVLTQLVDKATEAGVIINANISLPEPGPELITIWYSVQNGGDGSAYPDWFLTEEEAAADQSNMDEGWGEDCIGSAETYKGADIYLQALAHRELNNETKELNNNE